MKNQRSFLLLMLVFLLAIYPKFSDAQETILLNKYKKPIYNTKKYAPAFFMQVTSDSPNRITEKTYTLDTMLVEEHIFYKNNEDQVTRSVSKEYSTENGILIRTKQYHYPTATLVVTEYHENNSIKMTRKSVNENNLEEFHFNESGDTLDLRLFSDPLPHGGMDGWNEYLAKTISYPLDASQNGYEGTVYISFDLNEKGEMSGWEVMNPEEVYASLAGEALRATKKYPYLWTPRIENGIPASCRMFLPVRFSLKK